MFAINTDNDGSLRLVGRLDAASVGIARDHFEQIESSTRLDFSNLDYIASVGLGVLIAAQRRLLASGHGLTLTGMSPHLREVLTLAGFEGVFAFE